MECLSPTAASDPDVPSWEEGRPRRGSGRSSSYSIAPETLKAASAIFRAISDDCLHLLCTHVQEATLAPGEEIWSSQGNQRLCVLADGAASVEGPAGQRDLHSGAVVGEASLLGLPELFCDCGTVQATSACAVQVLHRHAFAAVLEQFPDEERSVARVVREASSLGINGGSDVRHLAKMLQRTAVFRGSTMSFLMLASRHLESAFYSPGEALFAHGDKCQHLNSPLYVVLGGEMHIEGAEGALVWKVGPEEVVGAPGSVGPVEARTTTARAGGRGLTFCARLPGVALQHALGEYPEERGALKEIVRRVAAAEAEAVRCRREWLEQVAVPALARTPLLAGCPEEALRALAAPLAESTCARGDAISEVGESARSMVVVLQGTVDLESRTGAKAGCLKQDGVFGEAELLGLLDTRIVSARAASACRLLRVTDEALRGALAGQRCGVVEQGLESLVAGRREQVRRGLPLTALSIGASARDTGVRALALHAERLHLEPGRFWEPLPDSDPCGPHLGVLARGHAVLTMASDGREVMTIVPGSLLIEGLIAEFKARVSVRSADCEIYRFRRFELEAAARLGSHGRSRTATTELADWFHQFRLAEHEARECLQERLSSAKGVTASRHSHPCDLSIQEWRQRRRRSLAHAQQIRQERADPPLTQLPLVPSSSTSSLDRRSSAPSLLQNSAIVRPASSGLPQDLPNLLRRFSAPEPAQHLCKAGSEPSLRLRPSKEKSDRRVCW